jgi:hypothetical protein
MQSNFIITIEYKSSEHGTSFELPDGQAIIVGTQKFRCP